MSQVLNKLSKYIPLYGSDSTGLLELTIKDDNSQLKCLLTFTQVRKTALFENIAGALETNPGNYRLVKTLDREIRRRFEFTQLEAIQLKTGLNEPLTSYLKAPSQPMEGSVYINCIPNLSNFTLSYDKAYILYNFVSFFVDSYDFIMVQYYNKPKVVENTLIINDDIQQIDNVQVERELGVFGELLSILDIPQTTRVFISKQLLTQELDVNVEVVGSAINIKHLPMYNFELWMYSPIHINELLNILNTLPAASLIDVTSKMKSLVRQLYHLSKSDNDNNYEFKATVTLILFMIYIYTLKMNESKFVMNIMSGNIKAGKNYLDTVRIGIGYIIGKFGIGGDIQSINIEYGHRSKSSEGITEKLQGSMEKFKYLNEIDSTLFKQEVFNSMGADTEPQDKHLCVEACTSINNPVILHIDSFRMMEEVEMTPKEVFTLTPSSNLSYIHISMGDVFKGRDIISLPYAQVLLLQNDGTNSMYIQDTNPIKLHYDMIANHMFPEIDKQKFLAENITSVFQIYQNFILPFMPNRAATSKTVQFLLFQVIIPYFYDKMGMRDVIDNFH